ncbi:MAG: S-layer homology domain-containing protein [Clostridiales bacterium]|nr:S-layer homology domain-containing protein [Clostridiales bacterium]
MKKILAAFAALTLTVSSMTGAFAIEYGSEWSGYESAPVSSFTDVPAGHWAAGNIDRVVKKGWFDGYPDGSFHPNASIRRCEAMTVFVKFLGLSLKVDAQSSYADVKGDNAWAIPYIEAGKKLFPAKEAFNGEIPFLPDQPITREDTVYALVTALRYTDEVALADQSVLNMFKDQNSISALIKPYVAVAVKRGLVAGYDDGTIGAQDPLTRAEFATLLYRASTIGFGNSELNLEVEEPTVEDITISPSSPYQASVGDSFEVKALAKMSDGIITDYSQSLSPVSTDSCISVTGTTVKALSPGTATIRFLNDAALADKTLTVIVSAPSEAPRFEGLTYPSSTAESTAVISGRVTDASGAALTLDIDSETINVSGGSFRKEVLLETGTNTFVLTLTNSYGRKTVETVRIKREAPSTPGPTVAPTVTAQPIDNNTSAASLTAYRWSVESLEINEGETSQIKLLAVYSDGTTKDCTSNYTLKSSDTNVATINSSGVIKGISGGSCNISFSMGAVSASISMPRALSVKVTAADSGTLTALEWSMNSMTVRAGSTKEIKLYGVYSDGSRRDLTEECGVYAMDESIATVSGNTVKGVGEGSTFLWFDSIPTSNINLPDMLEVEVTN